MKVLLGTQYYYPRSLGGTERYVLDLGLELKYLNIDVAILKVGHEPDYYYDGIKVFVIPYIIGNGEKINNFKEFNEVLDIFQPDIFHLNTLHPHLNGNHIKYAKKRGIKCFFTAHLPNVTCPKGDLLLNNEIQCEGYVTPRKCLNCMLISNNKRGNIITDIVLAISILSKVKIKSSAIDAIIYTRIQKQLLADNSTKMFVQSDWQKKVLIQNGFKNEHIKLIKLSISDSYLAFKKEVSKIYDICFIGRFSEEKGLSVLLRALQTVNTNLKICIILSIVDKDKPDIEKLVKENHKHQFDLHYNISKEAIINKLDESKILVIPSVFVETGPYVLLEAFSRDVPVIGSNIGGMKDMIKNGKNGYLFELRNINELAEKIMLLVSQIENKTFKFKINTTILSSQGYAHKIIETYKNVH
ncbi:glycosyltransferase [Pedobacter sp. N23S346]|uniref:glycosyltransferase n=1 Tax=Pedobacter sp. N23S346 TaxID=3402750 RepID=UPI003AD6A0D6